MNDNEIYAFMFSFPSAGKADISTGNFKKYILFTGKNKQITNSI
jgi:hypothetical protein